MPKGTKVDAMYQDIKEQQESKGVGKKTAERIAAATAQKRTGLSLATGKPPKHSRSYGAASDPQKGGKKGWDKSGY